MFEPLIKQTHSKAEETLEFKLTNSRETFPFNPLLSIEGSWMIGLTSLEIYTSTFNITEGNNNFKLYKFSDSNINGVSYEKVRDEIGRDLDISDITSIDSPDEVIGTIMLVKCRKQITKRMKND